MVEGKSAGGRREGSRCARIAPAVAWFLAVVALAAPAPAVARDPDRTRPAAELWDAYPLRPAQDRAAPDRAAGTGSTELAAAPSDGVQRLALASILALIAGGLTTWLVSLRWPRPQALPAQASATRPPDSAPVRQTVLQLWVNRAGAPVAEPDAPAPLPDRPPPAAPARSPGEPLPPEPERAWAAEIGWHLVDDASQFRVTARTVDGGEPITLGTSPQLEWPPSGARSVQALTDAVKTLESTLVTAGWTPLPRGSAWYAKRFTWQPGARPRPAPAIAVRTRHRRLYESEYARQVDRTERLRRTISARLIEQGRGVDAAAVAPE